MHRRSFFESLALTRESYQLILMLPETISIILIGLKRLFLHRVSPAEFLNFAPGIKAAKLKRPSLIFHYPSSRSVYIKLQSAIFVLTGFGEETWPPGNLPR
jgi:hypothetical protein